MKPELSVVIPAYNVARFIGAAVASALGQSMGNVEVIVVDDGSTDATPEILAGFTDPRLRVARQENGGLSAARNAGIALARADLVGFLDGDDLWHPDKARLHVDAMRADPGLGLTFSHSAFVDEDGIATGGVLFTTLTDPLLRDMILRNVVGNGSSPVVRKACFEIAGTFDETLRSCEDWEMWVRLLRDTPYRARLVPETLTSYRVNAGGLSMRFDDFLAAARQAAARIRRETPGHGMAVRRGFAACHRIAGTKAQRNGDRATAVKLYASAIRICPWLPFVDPRLAACLAVLPLPASVIDRLGGKAAVIAAHNQAPANSLPYPTGQGTKAEGVPMRFANPT